MKERLKSYDPIKMLWIKSNWKKVGGKGPYLFFLIFICISIFCILLFVCAYVCIFYASKDETGERCRFVGSFMYFWHFYILSYISAFSCTYIWHFKDSRGCQCYGYTNARKQEEIKLHEAGIFFVVCIYQWYLTESSE